jgi:hypothetical protein
MTFADNVILLFPAFLIGIAFAVLVSLGVNRSDILTKWIPIAVGALIGAVIGIVIFIFTARLWPPILGPFVLCPAFSLAGSRLALLFPRI